jgi:hypothetical protein
VTQLIVLIAGIAAGYYVMRFIINAIDRHNSARHLDYFEWIPPEPCGSPEMMEDPDEQPPPAEGQQAPPAPDA